MALPKSVKAGLTDYHAQQVYSSCIVGPHGHGSVTLFAAPLGQEIPRLGKVPAGLMPTHIPLTTNMEKAGELGCIIGDFAAKSLHLDFIGDLTDVSEILDHGAIEVRISGRRQWASLLRDLPTRFNPTLLVVANDTFHADLAFETPVATLKPVLIRVVFKGTARTQFR